VGLGVFEGVGVVGALGWSVTVGVGDDGNPLLIEKVGVAE
jgi:hypothetical protein